MTQVFDEMSQKYKRRHGYDPTDGGDPIREAKPEEQVPI